MGFFSGSIGKVVNMTSSVASSHVDSIIGGGVDKIVGDSRQLRSAMGVMRRSIGVDVVKLARQEANRGVQSVSNRAVSKLNKEIGSKMDSALGPVMDKINGFANGSIGDITGNIGDVTSAINAARSILSTSPSAFIRDQANGLINQATDKINNAVMSKVEEYISGPLDGLIDNVNEVTDTINSITSLANISQISGFKFGQMDIITNAVSGITDRLTAEADSLLAGVSDMSSVLSGGANVSAVLNAVSSISRMSPSSIARKAVSSYTKQARQQVQAIADQAIGEFMGLIGTTEGMMNNISGLEGMMMNMNGILAMNPSAVMGDIQQQMMSQSTAMAKSAVTVVKKSLPSFVEGLW